MLYGSPIFQKQYPDIFKTITHHTSVLELPHTKDIWARDFMPIKDAKGNWVLFRYYPKYLQAPEHHPYISDNRKICDALGLKYTYADIILDGGSVVYWEDEYFLSDRIYQDNPDIPKDSLLVQLKSILQTENIHILPCDPDDFTGHMDGIICFVNKETILLSNAKEAYAQYINNYMRNLGKKVVLLPYNPYQNKTYQSAKGVYINFVMDNNILFLPIFQLEEDQQAINILKELYPQHTIVPILCNQLSTQGGLLHCISWEM